MTPVVKKEGNIYSVEIAPKCFLRWYVEPSSEGDMMVIKIVAPALTHYARVHEADDVIALPLRYLPQ
jgi:hypothetical protein